MKRKLAELNVILRRMENGAGEGSNHVKVVDLVLAMIMQLHKVKETNMHDDNFAMGAVNVENKKHLAFSLGEALVPYGVLFQSKKRAREISLDISEPKKKKSG